LAVSCLALQSAGLSGGSRARAVRGRTVRDAGALRPRHRRRGRRRGPLGRRVHRQKGLALMKLQHLNLTTTDPTATADFLVRYFGLRNEGGNKGFMLVRDDDGMVITLMKSAKLA